LAAGHRSVEFGDFGGTPVEQGTPVGGQVDDETLGDSEGCLGGVGERQGCTFVAAFAGVVALWWIDFDRNAEAGAEIIATRRTRGAWACRLATASNRPWSPASS